MDSSERTGFPDTGLMPDCHGRSLVYVNVGGERYRVILVFDEQARRWRVRSAGAAGQDETNEPCPGNCDRRGPRRETTRGR